jgi:glucose-6-phosphate 1-dehydrogenase
MPSCRWEMFGAAVSNSAKAEYICCGRSWLRVVVEKPFGKDLCSSEALAEDIAKYYPEEQVRCSAATN